jgi:cation diffusion facilitator family transporter
VATNFQAREQAAGKKKAALLGIGSAAVLLALKSFLTIRTGSLGVLSEALHSGLDLVAAVITFLSVRVSDAPADEKHPYGHGKFENFSAFVETGLLLLTALYIIYEAFVRLFFRSVHIQPSVTAIVVLFVALLIDVTRAKALTRAAKKFQSEALEADALHFSTDVWSTMVVIAGILLVWAGEAWGVSWLGYADSFAALAVAGVIIRVGSQLGRRTLDALLDVAPEGLQRRIQDSITQMEGVLDAGRIRVRRAGNRYFVDVTVRVARSTSLERVHALSDAIEARIGEIIPSDVMVHVEPRAPEGANLLEAIRALAQRKGLAIHDLTAQQQDGLLFVELHLEVDENLSLGVAHQQATDLEEGIRELNGAGTTEVVIHIEPLGTNIARGDGSAAEMNRLSRDVESYLRGMPEAYPEVVNCHEVRARRAEHRTLVSCHCTMPSGLSIDRVHDLMAVLEARVKEHFPQVYRVTIHPEPAEDQ